MADFVSLYPLVFVFSAFCFVFSSFLSPTLVKGTKKEARLVDPSRGFWVGMCGKTRRGAGWADRSKSTYRCDAYPARE